MFLDRNGNGIQDDADAPLAGVVLTLYTLDGTVVATTNTDNNGVYLFEGTGVTGSGMNPNTPYLVSIDLEQSVTKDSVRRRAQQPVNVFCRFCIPRIPTNRTFPTVSTRTVCRAMCLTKPAARLCAQSSFR